MADPTSHVPTPFNSEISSDLARILLSLRNSWKDLAIAIQPPQPDIITAVETELDKFEQSQVYTEQSLTSTLNSVRYEAMSKISTAALYELTKKLQRNMYDFLFQLESLAPEEVENFSGGNIDVKPANDLFLPSKVEASEPIAPRATEEEQSA